LILRNLKIKNEAKESLIDIGINNNEEFDEKSGNAKIISSIEEVGDLSNIFGDAEFDLDGYEVESISGRLRIGDAPNIQIKKDGQIKFTIVNGNLINPGLY
jgi:hypothetical protein